MQKIKPFSWRDLSDDVTCWRVLVEHEPERSLYDTSSYLLKLSELVNANKQAANQVEFSRYFADFRREANLTVGIRRLMRTNGNLIEVAPSDSRLGDEV
jgi:hypothetical protein